MLTIKDAAQALGIHPKTIRRWEKSGKFIPQRTAGNQRIFTTADIAKLKALQENPLKPAVPKPSEPDITKPKFNQYLALSALMISLLVTAYLIWQNSQKISSPLVQQAMPNQDIQVALPQSAANFLNGRITIGTDTGDLSFLDEKGNLYVKNSALIEGGVNTVAVQFLPSQKPEAKQGRQYVDKDTGNLMYYDGVDWVTLNQSASNSAGWPHDPNQDLNLTFGELVASDSAASFRITLAGPQSQFKINGGADQELLTINDDSLYPVLINQPTKIMANLYSQKLLDNDNNAYFIDQSDTALSLNLAGEASLAATLNFTKYGEYITNSVDNYLVFSGGLGIGGVTSYGFSSDYKVKSKSSQVETELIAANLKITGNTLEALNNDGIKLYDNAGNGLVIADGGSVTINGVGLSVPDYVFEPGYQLMPLNSLHKFVSQNRHLPGMATESEINHSGLNLTATILQLLKQTEENVLYLFNLNERLALVEQKEALLPPPAGGPSPSPKPTLSEPELTEIIKTKLADLTSLYKNQTATATAEVVPVSLAPVSATDSAYLSLDTLEVNSGFFRDYLAVVGQTTLSALKVNGLLDVSFISPVSGSLNLLAGLMTLDQSGNVVINGNLTVTGTIAASRIETPAALPLSVNIATGSALLIYNDIGEALATFSGRTVKLNQLELNLAGMATISAGTNHTIIQADKLNPSSQIIITFNDDYKPATKYWVNKDTDNQRFTVFTNYPVNNDSIINWLIIN